MFEYFNSPEFEALRARLAQSPVSTLAVLVVLGSVVFFGIFLFFQVVAKWVQGDPSQADRRLPSTADTDPSDSGTITIPPPPKDPFDRFDNYFERFLRNTALGLSTAQSTAFMLFLGVILATATYLWREVVWLSVAAFLLGMMIPLVFFWFLQNRYRNQIQQSLPDTYYQLARSLRSGMTLEQAIEQVATRGQKPVSEEFQRATQQIKLGLSVPKALELMAPRIGLVDFDALVSTVSIYTQTGGNLALLLDRLAASTRDRNQFRGYFRSATAQGRVTAILIGGIAPLLVLGYAMIEPQRLQSFVDNPNGVPILIVCSLMEIIGIIWLFRMLRVDY